MRRLWRWVAVAAGGTAVGAWAQGVWETRAPYPLAATEVSAVVIQGQVYALCGLTASGSTNELFQYDPSQDTWRRRAPIPVPGGADHCNVAAVNDKLYLLGGLGILAGLSETYEYDPALDRWQVAGRMSSPRGASGVAVIGSRIYVAGGLGNSGSVATFEVFDAATRQWTRLPDLPTARDHLTAQAVQGLVYAISGRVGEVLPVNEEYNPATNTWRQRAAIPTPRGGLGSGVLRGRIQVFGGEGPSGTPEGTYRQNEEYDPAGDTWRTLAAMPTPRHGLYGATLLPPDAPGGIFTPAGGPRAGAFFSAVHEAFYLAPEEPPVVESGGLRNAASFGSDVAGGTLVSLFGRGLAPHMQAASRLPLATQMASVVVQVSGRPAPLLFVSPNQINVHLPHDLPAGNLTLTVTHAGVQSAAITAPLRAAAPGIFSLTQSGDGPGAVLIAGTGLLAGEIAGRPSRAVRRGEVVEIYGTGLGALSDSASLPSPGQPAPAAPLLRTLETPLVWIGGATAEVLFAGLAPGLVGVYQVNARVPEAAAAGPRAPVQLQAGRDAVSNTVTIAVAP